MLIGYNYKKVWFFFKVYQLYVQQGLVFFQLLDVFIIGFNCLEDKFLLVGLVLQESYFWLSLVVLLAEVVVVVGLRVVYIWVVWIMLVLEKIKKRVRIFKN